MDVNPDARAALIREVADLNEDEALAIVRERVANHENPFTIVEDCREGLRVVGERYERREYYLSGLIMAGEIFQEVMRVLGPMITDQYQGSELGVILLGTVHGDIHDIGKNILSVLLTSYGFTVHDLGVDVAAKEFLRQANQIQPDIIALSGLLTISFESMKETIALIRSQGEGLVRDVPVVVGGSTVDSQVCSYVGANHWANDAMVGVRLFKQLMENKR